ncbi:MAG: 3'-5' exonuclease domain-containing protein 2 [Paludibacter sp.]|nr:3'-5' exonuclease domain-containing protein 2 [Paludibacter sp.]MDD4198947.1 3'-5' exonuclease domain-containing protein 2 [Paludibacter sp.]MDD4427202.1 3'-5' exonuclease domain-containing protein 2 [Paludibacter sp.]
MIKPKISKEEVNELPIVVFEGKVRVVDSEDKVTDAMAVLCQQQVVGVDTETKPSFKKGLLHKVALLQISTEDQCFLFRLNKISFPKELGDFLSDKSVKKIGLALKDDFNGLNKLHRFKPENIVDLQSIVKSYGILELGLQKIFAIVFNQKISKSQRLTNWESPELTEQQQRYAATDAWAALMIYKQLMQEKKLTKAEIELLANNE